MSFFRYRAYNAAGETVSGVLETDSIGTLENQLRNAGKWLLDAHEAGKSDATTTTRSTNIKARPRDVVSFFVQMSLLLRAGITLPRALARLGDDLEDTAMGRVVLALGEKVEVGVPFHTAMEAYPKVFSPQVVAVVRAGEVSGQMSEVFESLGDYFEWMDKLAADVRQATIYPGIVSVVAVSFVLLLFTFIVPRFVGLLDDLALEVPLLTRIVMGISDAVVNGWPVLVATAIGIPAGLFLARRSPRIVCAWDRAKMRLPVLGPLLSMFAIARLAQNLAMLCRSGVPLLQAIEISRDLIGNRAVENAMDAVHRGVREGTPMSKTMSSHDVFPKTLVTMLSTGESTGSMDTALEAVAGYYNTLIPRRIKIVFTIFNPLVMLLLIGTIGVVALAVILPIIQLWDMR